MKNDEKLLSRPAAAAFITALGLTTAPQTLARKAHEGTGPEYVKAKNGRVAYPPRRLREYVAEQIGSEARSAAEHRRHEPKTAPPTT